MSETRIVKNSINRDAYGKMLMSLVQDKEKVQKKLWGGYPFIRLAQEYKCPRESFRIACETVGIEVPKRESKLQAVKPGPMTAMITVLSRVCTELNISQDELYPYLKTKEAQS